MFKLLCKEKEIACKLYNTYKYNSRYQFLLNFHFVMMKHQSAILHCTPYYSIVVYNLHRTNDYYLNNEKLTN